VVKAGNINPTQYYSRRGDKSYISFKTVGFGRKKGSGQNVLDLNLHINTL